MRVVKQISIVIDNAPGTLARITRAVRDEGINVVGFAAWGEPDHGIVRMVCDMPLKALDLLESAGMVAFTTDVLEIARQNQPGQLMDVAETLADARININYSYGSAAEGGSSSFYLGVSDVAGARSALK